MQMSSAATMKFNIFKSITCFFCIMAFIKLFMATAQRLGVDLGRLCTYDERMREAAQEFGMAVVAPR